MHIPPPLSIESHAGRPGRGVVVAACGGPSEVVALLLRYCLADCACKQAGCSTLHAPFSFPARSSAQLNTHTHPSHTRSTPPNTHANSNHQPINHGLCVQDLHPHGRPRRLPRLGHPPLRLVLRQVRPSSECVCVCLGVVWGLGRARGRALAAAAPCFVWSGLAGAVMPTWGDKSVWTINLHQGPCRILHRSTDRPHSRNHPDTHDIHTTSVLCFLANGIHLFLPPWFLFPVVGWGIGAYCVRGLGLMHACILIGPPPSIDLSNSPP